MRVALVGHAPARDRVAASGGQCDLAAPVITALQDDLNTPAALGALFTTINAAAPAGINAAGFDRAMFALGFNLAAPSAPAPTRRPR